MSDMNPLFTPLGLPDNESRTHRRSLRERPCDVLYVRAIEQVASGGAEHREEHDCPLHQGPEGGKGRTTLRPASCRALPRRTHTMRGNPRPRVAMGLPGSGCGVSLEAGMRSLVDMRMRVTGQNGVSDYDLGFTNFLYTFETSAVARADAAVRRRTPRTRRLG